MARRHGNLTNREWGGDSPIRSDGWLGWRLLSLYDAAFLVDLHVRQHRLAGVLAGPADRDLVHLRLLAESESHRQFALAKVAAGAGHLAMLHQPAGLQGHTSADGAAVRFHPVALQNQADPVVACAAVVAQQ